MYHVTSKYKVLFIIFDILSITLGLQIAEYFIRYDYTFFASNYFTLLLILVTFLLNIFTEEYRYIELRGYLKELKYSVIYSFKILIAIGAIFIFYKDKYLDDLIHIHVRTLGLMFIIFVITNYFFRISCKFILKQIKEEKKNILFITNFKEKINLENQLEETYNIVAYVTKDETILQHNGKRVLHNIEEIRNYLPKKKIDEIFISDNVYEEFEDLLIKLKLVGLPISINLSEFSGNYAGESVVKNIGDYTFITSATRIITLRQVVLKRILDIVGSIIGIIITFFVALIIYPKVQRESKGPLLFTQKRVGLNGKYFNIYKFRSMYLDAEERKKDLLEHNDLNTTLMFKMKEDPRIFPFGQKLRDWSLDELPQFINVLKGDMSLVGTRPPTVEEYEEYELHHFKRLATKPGITGLWQVSGRSDIEDFEEVVALDLKYIQKWSLSMDIKILLKTIKVVLKREGSR